MDFYTLIAAQVDAQHFNDTDRKKLPRYPIPCFRLGRLACRSDHQGRGLGQLLMGCAVERCRKARNLVGAYALLVDEKNENAKAFYRHHGLTVCVDSPMTLYLPLGQTVQLCVPESMTSLITLCIQLACNARPSSVCSY